MSDLTTHKVETLKEAIKQKEFLSPLQEVFVNVLYTSKHLDVQQNLVFRKHKLLMQHFNVMRIIKGNHPEPVGPSHIIDVMIDKGSDLTRLITKLVTMGLVERTKDPLNKRKVLINLTDMGLAVLEDMSSGLSKLVSSKENVLTDEEASQLSTLLDKLRSGF